MDIMQYILDNQLYLRRGYNLSDLSLSIDVPQYKIGQMVKKQCGEQLSDILNKLRVQHAVGLMAKGESRLRKLEAIGIESGFRNRNTFLNAFKRTYGVTIKEYVKLNPCT